MEILSIPRLYLTGIGKSEGRFASVLCLIQGLRSIGKSVSCVCVGASLSQAHLLRRMAARYVRIYDTRLVNSDSIYESVALAGVGADVVIIIGGNSGSETPEIRAVDIQLSKALKAPLVLQCNGAEFGEELPPILSNLQREHSDPEIASVLVHWDLADENRLGVDYYRGLFSKSTDPVIGALHLPLTEVSLPADGLVSQETGINLPHSFYPALSRACAEGIRLEELVVRAEKVLSVRFETACGPEIGRRTRIAIAEDPCFGFGIQDNFELLRHFGAELVYFSPLADRKLPSKIGMLYLAGGAISSYYHDLQRNTPIFEAISEFASKGGVIYSEGAGSALLSQRITLAQGQEEIAASGLIPGHTYARRHHEEVVEAIALEETVLGRPGIRLTGINTNEWELSSETHVEKTFRVGRLSSSEGHQLEGYSPTAQSLATFSFFHFGSNPGVAKNLVDASQVVSDLNK